MSVFADLRASAPDCSVFQSRLPMLVPLLTRGRVRPTGRTQLEESRELHECRSLDDRPRFAPNSAAYCSVLLLLAKHRTPRDRRTL